MNWLRSLFHSKNYLLLESILELVDLVFKDKCKIITNYESNLNKPELNRPNNLFNVLLETLYFENLLTPFNDGLDNTIAQ